MMIIIKIINNNNNNKIIIINNNNKKWLRLKNKKNIKSNYKLQENTHNLITNYQQKT